MEASSDTYPRRRFLKLVVAGAAGVGLSLASYQLLTAAAPGEKAFTLRARQFAFDPPVIRVNQGDRVTLRVVSEDVAHGLYIDGYDIELHMVPAEGGKDEATVAFVADKPGTFRMRCAETCGPLHPYMIGKLVVGPDLPFAGASVAAVLMALLSLVYLRRKAAEEGAHRAP